MNTSSVFGETSLIQNMQLAIYSLAQNQSCIDKDKTETETGAIHKLNLLKHQSQMSSYCLHHNPFK